VEWIFPLSRECNDAAVLSRIEGARCLSSINRLATLSSVERLFSCPRVRIVKPLAPEWDAFGRRGTLAAVSASNLSRMKGRKGPCGVAKIGLIFL
jgi:hypothetical protein